MCVQVGQKGQLLEPAKFEHHGSPITCMTSELQSYRGRCVCGFLGGVIVGGSMLNGVCVYVGVSVGVGGYACLYACVFR